MDVKTPQVTSGILFIIVGAFSGIFGLVITGFSSTAQIVNSSPLWWSLLFFLPVIFVESGIYWTRESLKMNSLKIEQENTKTSFFPKAAQLLAIINRYSTTIGIIVIIVFVVWFGYQFIIKNTFIFAPNSKFYPLVFGFIGYFFVRQLIFKGIRKFNKFANKRLPTYILGTDFVQIDLKIINLNNKNNKYVVTINFSDLDEIKELSFVETQTLIEYKVGPDVSLQASASKDLIDYTQNKIPRPRYYIFGPNTGSKTLLLRGKDIYYLISVANQDNSELFNAFAKYKSV